MLTSNYRVRDQNVTRSSALRPTYCSGIAEGKNGGRVCDGIAIVDGLGREYVCMRMVLKSLEDLDASTCIFFFRNLLVIER